MIRRLLAATALVAGLSSSVRAEALAPEPAPAGTREGADTLRAALAAYVTQAPFEKGLLRVEPDPAGQRITLDVAPFARTQLGMPIEASPLSVVVSPRPDGDWNVFSGDPIRVRVETTVGDRATTFAYTQGEQAFKGIFAPGLLAYRAAEGLARDTAQIQDDPSADAHTTVALSRLSMSARPGTAGGVDIDLRQTMTGYAQTIAIRPPPPTGDGTPETPSESALAASLLQGFRFAVDELETRAAVKGGRTVEIADLYTLLLAHADALESDPRALFAGPFGAAFREALLKLVPLWSTVDVAVVAREASLHSPFGTLRAAQARQVTHLTGLAEDAGIETDVAVEGVSVEGAALPPWVAGLLPLKAAFGVSVSGFDLGTIADLAIRNADFTAAEPLSDEVKARITETFDPSRLRIALKPSTLRAGDLALDLSGAVTFENLAPAGTLSARAAGLDETIAALREAARQQPDLHQVVGVIQLAQGLGRKTDDGRWEWVVEAAADGSVSVNGMRVKDPEATPGVEGEPAAGAPG